jgi:hypothetical protein
MTLEKKEKNGKYQHLVSYCIDLFTEYESPEYREKKIEAAIKARKIYEQKNEITNFPWENASNIILPLTTITIDNLEPRFVSGLVAKKPFAKIDMDGMTEQPPEYEILQDWFNDELAKVVKIDRKVKNITHDVLLEGTVFIVLKYMIEEKKIRVFQFDQQGNIVVDPESGQPVTHDTIEQGNEGVSFEFVPLTDMYCADNITDWEKADFIRVIRPSYAELQRLKDVHGYMNIDSELLGEETEIDEILSNDLTPAQEIEGVAISGKKAIECYECHISYIYRDENSSEEDQEDFEEERIIATITKETQTLIRFVLLRDLNMKNEHVIKRMRIYSEEGRTYGTSIYEKLKSIQDGASDIFNLVINSSTITMMPWFLYSDKAGLPKNPKIYPGVGIPCDNPSEVVFPRFATNPDQHTGFIDMFMNLWERLGSIGDLQVGRNAESGTTATEVMAVIEEGNLKHNYQGDVLKEDFKEIIKTIWDLYYKNMPINKQFVYQGQQINIPRQLMERTVNFTLTGSTNMANKLIERKENEVMFQQLRPDPIINPIKLVEDIVKTYKPNANAAEYINPEINQVLGVLQANPEIKEIISNYMKEKGVMENKNE